MADGNAALLREGDGESVAEARSARTRAASRKRLVRWTLLLVGPLVVVAAALYLYLSGGRYVSTDDAYVRADTVALATDIPGTVESVEVVNNAHVQAGQVLFRLDDEPYRIARDAAAAQLGMVANDIEAQRATYRQKLADLKQAEADVAFYEREYQRQAQLRGRNVSSESQYDQARRNLDVARQKVASLRQEAASVLANLGGEPDRPTVEQARYLQAKAQLDRAERDLRRTVIRAPMAGVVTNVDALQKGEYLQAGQTAFNLVATDHVWIEANPKETQLTYVKPGDPVTVTVDTYPGREWTGTVASLSPATGAEFALLPPQNASGNWVKVVQRIPVRLRIETPEDAPPLRAGMSAIIEIDTGHRRSLGDLFRTAARWIGV